MRGSRVKWLRRQCEANGVRLSKRGFRRLKARWPCDVTEALRDLIRDDVRKGLPVQETVSSV